MEVKVKVNNLTVSYSGKKVFENISFSVGAGQLVGIIGPNGAGKSTLLKSILGLMAIDRGEVKILNGSVGSARRKIAYVPQRNDINLDFPVSVEDVVMMGRFPHLTWWGMPRKNDRKVVTESLEEVDMIAYRHRQIGQLSGGQLQRVFLARALAQEAELFFLDEPFAGIDMSSESMIMDLLKGLRDQGKSIFVVHHDLSKAEIYFDTLVLLKNRLVAFGSKDMVFREETLREAYEGRVSTFSGSDKLMVVNG
ncbi:metal ABC transporter ATP-binding protein [Candidatus Contubernalis alkaliaceticus]|uniref:metal ABC transporter ATP-binding protein n=1 Tax=Candidatus Contubernalis alkaliaceticus TaxID=338645 RepID=UPI001F4C4208|nr:metal ABC transporter ATP-binding protein [Candidatus Contubernalis alkalaceticus]UNC91962.1 metal ABC transporter ATP-binding protein [Candidatus Contubernalis alkalaceticus]